MAYINKYQNVLLDSHWSRAEGTTTVVVLLYCYVAYDPLIDVATLRTWVYVKVLVRKCEEAYQAAKSLCKRNPLTEYMHIYYWHSLSGVVLAYTLNISVQQRSAGMGKI